MAHNSIAQYRNRIRELDLPIVTLEIRRRFRRITLRATMFILLSVFVAIAVLALYALRREIRMNTNEFAHGVVAVASYLMLVGSTLFVPLHAARSFSAEREAKTLEILAMTPMTSLSVVVQKALVPLMQMGMMMAATLPALLLIFLVTLQFPVLTLAVTYILVALLSVFYAGIGVFFSSLSGNSSAAVFLSLVTVVAGIPVITYIFDLHLLNPWVVMQYLLGCESYTAMVLVYLPILVAATMMIYRLCVLRFEAIRTSE